MLPWPSPGKIEFSTPCMLELIRPRFRIAILTAHRAPHQGAGSLFRAPGSTSLRRKSGAPCPERHHLLGRASELPIRQGSSTSRSGDPQPGHPGVGHLLRPPDHRVPERERRCGIRGPGASSAGRTRWSRTTKAFFAGFDRAAIPVWMSHGDALTRVPEGFDPMLAVSSN